MLFDPIYMAFENFQIHTCKIKHKSVCDIVIWIVYPDILMWLEAL